MNSHMGATINYVACMIGIYKLRHSYQVSSFFQCVLWKIFFYLTTEVLSIIRCEFFIKVILGWIEYRLDFGI